MEIYRPIRGEEVKRKTQRSLKNLTIKIPPKTLFYTDDFEEVKNIRNSAMQPVYLKKDIGWQNENNFIKYLEAKREIEWWHKNGDFGSEFFAIQYEESGNPKMFYPDWIVKISNGILVLETKSGDTAKSENTRCKAEALQKWLKDHKGKIDGGIVVSDAGVWKINKNMRYQYSDDFKGWELLDESF